MDDFTSHPLPKGEEGVKQAINLLLGIAELVEAGALDPGLFRIAVETQTLAHHDYSGLASNPKFLVVEQGVRLDIDLASVGCKQVAELLASDKWQC